MKTDREILIEALIDLRVLWEQEAEDASYFDFSYRLEHKIWNCVSNDELEHVKKAVVKRLEEAIEE